MADIVKVEGITKVYGDAVKTQVLYDMDLGFEAGSFNSIIGASGSGKSTLLNILGTLDKPTTGRVYMDGRDTVGMTPDVLADLRNRTVGFVFQFHYLLPEFTALENVLMPYLIGGGRVTGEVRHKAKEIMGFMGLEKVMDNPSTKMSGGQQQRTAIARALMNGPKLILADEPTGNLDSESTENVYGLLRKINLEQGTTFVIVTHDRRIAEKADRIVEVKDGRITLDLLNSPDLGTV